MEAPSESRYITTDQTVHTLGLNILGGNATGIFVCDVKSPGYVLGIRTGDQILQVHKSSYFYYLKLVTNILKLLKCMVHLFKISL